MNDVDFSEARSRLSQPLYCEDIEDWHSDKMQPDTWQRSGGLLDASGMSVRMVVKLAYRRSQKTGWTVYVFSVFLQHPGRLERVYQLDVRQHKKPISDLHLRPHEHFGNQRNEGDPSWGKWSFQEVLAYFMKRTGVEFNPPVASPEEFELKGQKR